MVLVAVLVKTLKVSIGEKAISTIKRKKTFTIFRVFFFQPPFSIYKLLTS